MGDLFYLCGLVMITIGKGVGDLSIVAVDVVAADDPGAVGNHRDVSTVLQDVAFCNLQGVAISGEHADPVLTPLGVVDMEHIAGFDAANVREPRPGTSVVIVVDVTNEVGCICTTSNAAVGREFRSLVVAPGNAVLPATIVDEIIHLLGGCGIGDMSERNDAGVIGLAAILAEPTHFIGFAGSQSIVELFAFANFIPDRAGCESTVLSDDVLSMSGPAATLNADLCAALRNRDPGRVLDGEVEAGSGCCDVRDFWPRNGGHGCCQRGGGNAKDGCEDHCHRKDQFGKLFH